MIWLRGTLLVLGACLCALEASAAESSATVSLSSEAQAVIAQLDHHDAYIRQQAFLRLEALREPATAAVVRRYLNSRQATTRAWSLRAVAAIEGINAISTLRESLRRDRNPYVRLQAVLALEPLMAQEPSVLDALIGALRDRHYEVRMAAVDAVSRIEQPKARSAIRTRWKRERHRDVRRVLQQALTRLGGS